jgi:hypothetical protein
MATRDQLAAVGAKTIRDAIAETLKAKGIEDAVGFELKLTNGETISITSDSNPALDRPAAEVRSVDVKQSARAGLAQIFTVLG